VRYEVNLAILRLLNRLNIDIPFPQRVVRTVEAPAAPTASTAPSGQTEA
jgi:small-conductance mechanosensitive channel